MQCIGAATFIKSFCRLALRWSSPDQLHSDNNANFKVEETQNSIGKFGVK